MKILGQKLKETRESKGISLNEVAVATKINIKILGAIEDGDLKSLPQKTFLRGFIRSYASYLKMDVPAVLDQFQESIGSTRPIVKTEPDAEMATQEAAAESNSKVASKLILAVIGLILVLASVAVYQVIKKYEQESAVPKAAEETPATEDNTNAVATTEPIPSKMDEPVPSIAEAEPNPSISAVELSKESEVIPSLTVAAAEKPAEKPVIVPVAPVVTPAPTPSPKVETVISIAPTSEKTKPAQEIILEAFENVNVDIYVDGTKSQSISLQGGQVRTVKLRGQVSLDISNAGALNLIHNGRDKGVPGVLGQPLKIKLP